MDCVHDGHRGREQAPVKPLEAVLHHREIKERCYLHSCAVVDLDPAATRVDDTRSGVERTSRSWSAWHLYPYKRFSLHYPASYVDVVADNGGLYSEAGPHYGARPEDQKYARYACEAREHSLEHCLHG